VRLSEAANANGFAKVDVTSDSGGTDVKPGQRALDIDVFGSNLFCLSFLFPTAFSLCCLFLVLLGEIAGDVGFRTNQHLEEGARWSMKF
jgi:hypothetical protein